MIIKDLPFNTRYLVFVRTKQSKKIDSGMSLKKFYDKYSYLRLKDAFAWRATLEGYDFWFEINNGNKDVFYTRYPKQPKVFRDLYPEIIDAVKKRKENLGLIFNEEDSVDSFNINPNSPDEIVFWNVVLSQNNLKFFMENYKEVYTTNFNTPTEVIPNPYPLQGIITVVDKKTVFLGNTSNLISEPTKGFKISNKPKITFTGL